MKIETVFSLDSYYNPAYDYKTHTYKNFGSWQRAVMFAQQNKMKLDKQHFCVLKVEEHYEIH